MLLLTTAALAQEHDPNYYKIKSMTVTEVPSEGINKGMMGLDQIINPPNPIETAGKVISTARDLVALGEDVYKLVIKGKPTNTTSYAPISVVPKNGADPVDPLEMENWTIPVQKSYEVKYYNYYNILVVHFKYSVMFSYRGSYNGKGAYLTGVQVIPTRIRTIFPFDFTATMKLGGVQNIGTSKAPVAAGTLVLEYTVSSFANTIFNTDRFVVTGQGGLKKY